MRKTIIAVSAAVLGASAYAAFAQPTLDVSPNRAWRNAPESTLFEQRAESGTKPVDRTRPIPADQQEPVFTFNP